MTGARPGADRRSAAEWPSAATTVTGVIGDPVEHSLSPLLHNCAFGALRLDWVSVGFPVRAGRAEGAVRALVDLGLAGFSVTMPHKATVARAVDDLDPVAAQLGAVNCCVRQDGGRVRGVNTDGVGFLAALRRGTGTGVADRSCVVVGAGGAARAVVLALAREGAASVTVVARRPERAAAAAELAGTAGHVVPPEDAGRVVAETGATLVVDATPAGMAGTAAAGDPPLVGADQLGPDQVAVDLVYHPLLTPWLDEARRRGATVLGGLGMLVHQAAEQLVLWTGVPAPVEEMWRAAEAAVGGAPGASN